MPAKKAAKKAAAKTAPSSSPAKKAAKKTAPAKKAAPAAKKTAPRKKAATTAAAPVDLEVSAYLNYRSRLETGYHGDELGDWLAAEKAIQA